MLNVSDYIIHNLKIQNNLKGVRKIGCTKEKKIKLGTNIIFKNKLSIK